MADLLSQNEIDNLLNSSLEEESSSESDVGSDIVGQGKTTGKLKTFSFKKEKNIRYTFPYNSPVLKKENVIFNPGPDAEIDESKPVVRSLKNYVEYINFKRNS